MLIHSVRAHSHTTHTLSTMGKWNQTMQKSKQTERWRKRVHVNIQQEETVEEMERCTNAQTNDKTNIFKSFSLWFYRSCFFTIAQPFVHSIYFCSVCLRIFTVFFFHLFFRKYKRNIRKVRCLCALFNPSAFWYFFPLRLYHLLCTTHSMRKMSYFKCDTLDKQWSKKKNESNNNNNNNNLCLTVYCGDFADYSSLVCLVYNCKVAAILIAERAMPNYFHAK